MVSVCTGLLGGEGRVSASVDTRLQTEYLLPFYHIRLIFEQKGVSENPKIQGILYNWLIWRVLKLACFFSKKYFPCIYFGVWSSQNNAIFM